MEESGPSLMHPPSPCVVTSSCANENRPNSGRHRPGCIPICPPPLTLMDTSRWKKIWTLRLQPRQLPIRQAPVLPPRPTPDLLPVPSRARRMAHSPINRCLHPNQAYRLPSKTHRTMVNGALFPSLCRPLDASDQVQRAFSPNYARMHGGGAMISQPWVLRMQTPQF